MMDHRRVAPLKGAGQAAVAGQRFKRNGRNDIFRVFGQENMNVRALLDEDTDEVRNFIGRDSAGYADENGFS